MTILAGSRMAPPELMARAGQRGPVDRPGSQAGNILHLDCTTVGPELRPPELDIPPYAGLQALNVYAHMYT